MPSKRVYEVQAGERLFYVRISSEPNGYSARISEVFHGVAPNERCVPAALYVPPRLEVDPGALYRDRQHYRVELIKLVNAELAAWRVKKVSAAEVHLNTDAYIRANLAGWPDGYPNSADDDMSDWDHTWPGDSAYPVHVDRE
ncbi:MULTISPECIES: hypothetical protein [unclassified Burkholderia]|uniref:hypothetical protein n=1 Tax=unclassified Burkholderia TaxID=2613784 RepID=UPI002AB0B50C|nr:MULTISPECIES: hypothetical protein [unclassified Burkholderia]